MEKMTLAISEFKGEATKWLRNTYTLKLIKFFELIEYPKFQDFRDVFLFIYNFNSSYKPKY